MSSIKNVAVAGGSGSLGSAVLNGLVTSGNFNITVLKRATSTFQAPPGVRVIDVDYDSPESLQSALSGQDAVVSTLGSAALQSQIPLIDAAIAAGVKRFIPSEFGCDLDNPETRKLPVFGPKVQVQNYLQNIIKTSELTYTAIYNAAFLDWGLQRSFLLNISDSRPRLLDGGGAQFSAAFLSTIADAVVGVLKHPKETENRSVRIQDLAVSQKELLELAREAAPEKSWEPETASLDDLTKAADARLAQGLFDAETFVPYLYRALLDPRYGSHFVETDNELLELKTKTKADVVDVIKQLLK